MNVPRNLDAIAWDGLQFFSWIDDKNPQKACLIIPEQDGNTEGIVLTRAKTQGKRAQMCSFCMTLRPGSGISLFSAAKVGEAGRRSNTLGTYIRSNLHFHDYVTGKKSLRVFGRWTRHFRQSSVWKECRKMRDLSSKDW